MKWGVGNGDCVSRIVGVGGTGVRVGVWVGTGVEVSEGAAVRVCVGVKVADGAAVGVRVAVLGRVHVGVGIRVGVLVAVRVAVGTGTSPSVTRRVYGFTLHCPAWLPNTRAYQ